MAFQPVPNTVEIDVIYSYNAVIAQNTFYAELAGGYVLADLQDLADAIDFQVATTWLAEQPAEAIYLRTEVRGLAEENDITADQDVSTGPGTHVGTALPGNVTFSIKKTSGLTGRSARGRTYWIGIPNGELNPLNENLVEAVWAAAVVDNVGLIRTAIAAVGLWLPVLVSRFSGGAQRTEGVTFPWTGEVNVDLRIDTLRNRLPVL